jgi:hypothetical protein
VTEENKPTEETETAQTEQVPPEAPAANADATAEIERLKAQLAEVAPIVQAHKDAEEARKSAEEKLREELTAAQRERDEAQRGLLIREVAEETGLSSDVVALFGSATTKAELLAAASKVADQSKARKGTTARPNPIVGGGADAKSTESDEIDPVKLAAAIAKRVRF